MHEKSPVLQAANRQHLGSRHSARARSAGKLPAIVYGHGLNPLPIHLDAKEALTHIRKGEKVFRLDFPGTEAQDEGQMVLLKDLQYDYLGTNVIHLDFARVDLNERIHTRVHVNLVGDAKGLKTAGAILMHPVMELEIECRVVDLPDSLEVNVADLDVDGVITAGQVPLPVADMKLLTDSHAIVAQVTVQKEVATTAEAAAVTADAAQPEVITAKKPAEGEAAAGAAKGAAAKPAGDKKK